MIRNYFTTAIRSIQRSAGFSFINLIGLAIGLASCIFIALWITDELSYDRYLPDASRIYRIILKDSQWSQPRTPHPMPLAMVADFPEVTNGVSISPIWGTGLTRPEFTVEYNNHKFEEKGFMSADSTFFQVFQFPFVAGDPATALKKPMGIVITQSMAKKYFGKEQALGKMLKVEDNINLEVTGVVKDIPANTHFTFDFLVSYVTLKARDRANNNGTLSDYYTWNDFGHYNYIVLAPGVDPKTVESKMSTWILSYIKLTPEQKESVKENNTRLLLQPITSIHLHSNMIWELGKNGNMAYVYAFSVTALLILLIAIFNYMNLATARSEKRAREVGVRKTLGARKDQLVSQFLVESMLLALGAVLFAALLVELFMPLFNQLTGKHLQSLVGQSAFVSLGLLIVAAMVGLLAGSYPAFFLTSFKPITVLKGKITASRTNINLRKLLVTFQFAISTFLIIFTLAISGQIQLLKNKNMGFNKDQVVVVPIKVDAIKHHIEAFKEALEQDKSIVLVGRASNIPGGQFNNNSIQWKSDQEGVNAAEMWVDDDFFKVLEIPMAKGRAFSQEFASDSVATFILNESACKSLNMADPIGQQITWYGDSPGTLKGTVVGVVKNFNFRSLHENIGPLIIQHGTYDWQYSYALIRIKPSMVAQALSKIETTFKQFAPQAIFNYSFLDQDFAAQYEAENRMGTIFTIFAVMAIVVACLGLLGLAAFTVEQKTKEIGIRKVHGASSFSIFNMVSKSFAGLVLLSTLLAWPAAYFSINSWLNDYAYRITISPWYFVLGTALALIIAALTTGYQSLKAAQQNPIESLKYE